jgi:hypothetical protein
MRHFVGVLGQRLVVVFERGVGIERQVELVDPAEVEAGAAQRVGWLERSETHQTRARPNDGFRKALPIQPRSSPGVVPWLARRTGW